MQKIIQGLFLVILVLGLTGCWSAGTQNGGVETGHLPPGNYGLPALETARPARVNGAIYRVDGGFDLYADRRARRVGDLVVVKIVENSSGSKKATTTTGRKSSVSGGISSLFGAMQYLNDKNDRFTPSATNIQAELANDFEGTGETRRDSTVTATLSARVVEKTMDGNLLIRGFREVKVNDEVQHIILSGIIRPRDIARDNSILSSYITDARIEYGGTGVISESQRPGWLARGLNVVWPF